MEKRMNNPTKSPPSARWAVEIPGRATEALGALTLADYSVSGRKPQGGGERVRLEGEGRESLALLAEHLETGVQIGGTIGRSCGDALSRVRSTLAAYDRGDDPAVAAS
jgi:hypothetical protein